MSPDARREESFVTWDEPRQGWLLPGRCRERAERTVLLEVTTRLLFPVVLVFSLYLLLVGHYGTGGGFSGGLVAGLAFVLVYLTGGDATSLLPVRPPVLLGSGLVIALVTAIVPLAFGAQVLTSTKLAAEVPLLGSVEVQTSVFLDVGVYVLIVGAVLDLLRSLGAGVERDMHDAGER